MGVWDNGDPTGARTGQVGYAAWRLPENVGKTATQKPGGGLLGGLLPIALSFIAPGLGTAIGSALGAEGLAASVLGNAVVGGATSGLTGGNVLTGALSGGLGGAMGGLNIAGDYLNVTDPALAKAVNSGITSGAKQLLTTGDIDLGNLAANTALGYGTNVAGGAIGKEFDLTPDQTKAVTGGLGALVRGGDIGDAALGAASGYTGAPISNLYGMYKRASSPAGTTLAGSSPSMANLYQQYLNSKKV